MKVIYHPVEIGLHDVQLPLHKKYTTCILIVLEMHVKYSAKNNPISLILKLTSPSNTPHPVQKCNPATQKQTDNNKTCIRNCNCAIIQHRHFFATRTKGSFAIPELTHVVAPGGRSLKGAMTTGRTITSNDVPLLRKLGPKSEDAGGGK